MPSMKRVVRCINAVFRQCPDLYFLGLAWLSRRASPFIWGVWHDAEYLAGHIVARSAGL